MSVTRRELFAVTILQGLLSNEAWTNNAAQKEQKGQGSLENTLCTDAVTLADALCRALDRSAVIDTTKPL